MNICSNQIKEVILHRFKVKTLQKLLIHINFLLAFFVLFCSHSAFGQSGASAVVGPTVTLVGRDYSGIPNSSYIVDLGLSDVYWADRNVGANSPTDAGTYFAWGEIKQQSYKELFPQVPYTMLSYTFYDYWKGDHYYYKYWNNTQYPRSSANFQRDGLTELLTEDDAAAKNWKSNNEDSPWHIPTTSQINNLISNCSFSRNNNDAIFRNTNSNKSIRIPATGYLWENATSIPTMIHIPFFWSKTLDPTTNMKHNSYRAMVFRLHYLSFTPELYSADRFAGIPVRPVIDKFLVTYIKNIDGVTTSTDTIHVPNGTKITLSASDYGCYDLAWTKVDEQSSESNNGSAKKEFTTTITSNTTITASFTSRKYSVSAYIKYGDSDAVLSSKDENLECGQYATISVPIDNCYVFQGWEGPGITGRLAAGENNNGYSCQVDNSVSPTQASLTIPNIDSNTQLNRDYTAIFSIKTTNIKATTDSSKGWVGLNVWK